MTDFMKFKMAIKARIEENMIGQGMLMSTDVDPDELWECYLDSFPPGTNEIYRERREYDCQCCRRFIRDIGGIVLMKPDLTIETIWDIDIDYPFKDVVKALNEMVLSSNIKHPYLHWQKKVGTDYNYDQELVNGEPHRWDHFYFELPEQFVLEDGMGTEISHRESSHHVLKRGLETITKSALEIVLELMDQTPCVIYRGAEFRTLVEAFKNLRDDYDNFLHELEGSEFLKRFAWMHWNYPGARIRNTAIGTLLVDISEGMELDEAVRKFGVKLDPRNYKHTNKVVSPAMVKKAEKRAEEMGIVDSLPRRHAVLSDIALPNVLFADRQARKSMNVFDTLKKEAGVSKLKLRGMPEISIDDFISKIVPNVSSIQMLVENRLEPNFVSLIAPMNYDAPGLFPWDNKFSWVYAGEVSDSIRERVQRAGGNVDGVVRCSLAWHNTDDLDLHVKEWNGDYIFHENAQEIHPSSGVLDVDMNVNVSDLTTKPVENIVWTDKDRMPYGTYQVMVNQYRRRNNSDYGFVLEIVLGEDVYILESKEFMKTGSSISFTFEYKRDGTFVLTKDNGMRTDSSKEVWGVKTEMWQRISTIMYSPNHWLSNKHTSGNKHWFFMIDGCKAPKPMRGFMNEFLRNEFREDRKVFDLLGTRMKTEVTDDQLSGLGFSSTVKNHVLVKVSGTFNRTVKVVF